jgi:hypothetical protein
MTTPTIRVWDAAASQWVYVASGPSGSTPGAPEVDEVYVGPTPPPSPFGGQMWVNLTGSGGSGGGGGTSDINIEHVDPAITGQPMLLVRDDQSIIAVPADVTRPAPPTGIIVVVKMSYVRLTWTGSFGSAIYYLYRDGVLLGTTGGTSYRDETIQVGPLYTYTLRAANNYGMRGAVSAPVTAQAHPSDNSAPVVQISVWPAVHQPGQKQVVRVAAVDVDAQTIALTLNASAGSLEATADPSVWLLSV